MKNTDFNELSKRAFENAKAKGFHDKPLTDAHCIMLVACELAEAVEADRMGRIAKLKEYKTLFYTLSVLLYVPSYQPQQPQQVHTQPT